MNKSCWSCKHCINDYFATGTMDCKKQDDMTEEEFENCYGDNGGENCTYYEEIQKRKQQREAERKQKFTYRFMHKVACMCGIM